MKKLILILSLSCCNHFLVNSMQKNKKKTGMQHFLNYTFGISTDEKLAFLKQYYTENPSLEKKECLYQAHLYFAQTNDVYSRYFLTQLWHLALKK